MKFHRRLTAISGGIFIMALFSSSSYAQPTGTNIKGKRNAVTVAALTASDSSFDISASTARHYHCELNDSMILYTNHQDEARATLRWKDKLYHLSRIETSTGADRFENKQAGLVWIGIPTKAMLLDSIHGQQLANECKTNP